VVLADRGINAKVEPGTWEGIVERLAAGARAGHLGDALVSAIEECGRLLQAHGVARRDDDVDELSDAARLRDR
jgi:putative membrane protein